MADKEIGDLTAASALDGTETVHVVQGGNSRRTTTQGIADLGGGEGCLLSLPSALSTVNASSSYFVPYGASSEQYDDAGYHDTGSNTTRITIPAAGRYIFFAGADCTLLTTTDYFRTAVWKNGAFSYPGRNTQFVNNGQSGAGVSLVTPPLSCVAGDFFEHWVDTLTDTSITLTATATYFGVLRVK